MPLREPVTQEQDAALTVRQRRWATPRNAYERKILKRLFYWYIAISSLLFFPMPGIAWLVADAVMLAVYYIAFHIWYRRRTPRTAAQSAS